MKKFIGLDAGSVSVKIAVLDAKGNVLETKYVRHKGKPLTVAYELLKSVMRSLLTSHFLLQVPEEKLLLRRLA